MSVKRLQILMTGLVQGVGFRPHVYRVAQRLGLTGWVQNNASGVLMEIQGVSFSRFLPELTASLPPLAKIDEIQTQLLEPIENEHSFEIMASKGAGGRTIISPDVAICSDCLSELFEPGSRYFHYPFLNCTQCGPRLTVTRKLPYDRAQTSMDVFPLCLDCQRDYTDPTNRRYHAQPTACSQCGPQLSMCISDMA